ncbi:unnamed protein product [Cunninghamella blakesleeana]
MSTLNALGFNVRRQRNNDTTKQQGENTINKGKLTTTTSSLAFSSELLKEVETQSYNKKSLKQPSSLKLKQTSISKYTKKATLDNNNNNNNNYNNTNNNNNKRNNNNNCKDPKQSSLLAFLSTTTSFQSLHTDTITDNNSLSTMMNHENTLINNEKDLMDEDSYHHHYSIRHPMTLSDVFPLLVDSFGIYDNHLSSSSSPSTTSSPLILEVKPNKKILSSTIDELNLNNNEHIIIKGIRRNRQHEDEEEDKDLLKGLNEVEVEVEEEDDDDSDATTGSDLSLPSAFTKSMNFYPMKKRYCIHPTIKNATNHSSLFDDLKENYTQNEDDLYEKKDLKHRFTIDQVNSLLLDIANEYLAFENNEWCSSYIK